MICENLYIIIKKILIELYLYKSIIIILNKLIKI